PMTVHFRRAVTVVEPSWLEGLQGGIGASATLRRPARKGGPSDVTALVQLSRFDLSRLPQFALPPDLDLRGLVSGRVAVDGKLPKPQVDARLELRGGGVRRVQGVDLDVQAILARERLRAQIDGSGPAGVRISLRAEAPLGSPA